MDWNEVEKAGLGAAVVGMVGAFLAYLRSIGNKADKAYVEQLLREQRAEFERQIEVNNRRVSGWEAKAERFATREMVDQLNAKIDRMEIRSDANFEKLHVRLDKLIERDREK